MTIDAKLAIDEFNTIQKSQLDDNEIEFKATIDLIEDGSVTTNDLDDFTINGDFL